MAKQVVEKWNFPKDEFSLVNLIEIFVLYEKLAGLGMEVDGFMMQSLKVEINLRKDEEKEDKEFAERRKVNPFSLYYIGDKKAAPNDLQRAEKASKKIKRLLNGLVKDLMEINGIKKYKGGMKPVADKIIEMGALHVGVGDTETDECMANYLEAGLKRVNKTEAQANKLAEKFYFMIH
jgi:hypothetical protein